MSDLLVAKHVSVSLIQGENGPLINLAAVDEEGVVWVYDGRTQGWDPVPMRKKRSHDEANHG